MTRNIQTKKPRCERIRGICRFSRALNVSREHLYRVIRGKRKSPGLLASFEALKSQTQKPTMNVPMSKADFTAEFQNRVDGLLQKMESLRALDEINAQRMREIKREVVAFNATLGRLLSESPKSGPNDAQGAK